MELHHGHQSQLCFTINFCLTHSLVCLSHGDTKVVDNAPLSPRQDLDKCLCIPEVGALLSENLKERMEAKEKGSILTRAGILEAVFEQGEECSARGRISARGGEENNSSGNERTGKTVWD